MPSTTDSSSTNGRKDPSHAQELAHTKMLRGDTSCRECRRLKQKCDKKVPCSSCVRRNCRTICPLGVLGNGQHKRQLLTQSNQLRTRIAEMVQRIDQLEDALRTEFHSHSDGVHPLLTDDLLEVKKGVIVGDPAGEAGELEGLDAMGLLAINEEENYFGATGQERALLVDAGVTLPREAVLFPLSIRESPLWPFRPACASTEELHLILEMQLPSHERALELSEIFLENLSSFFRPVTQDQLLEFLIPTAYRPRQFSSFAANTDLHDLALLYMIFAVGAALDLENPPVSAEGERYVQLARAALGLKSIFEYTSLAAIQTIALMSCYNVFTSRTGNLEEAWKMTHLAFNLGLSIGLHRDPARWALTPDEVQTRRILFWEMCVVDIQKSIASGRPLRFPDDTVDCELPIDTEATVNEDGSTSPSCWHMKFRFVKDVLAPVARRLCAARPPRYTDVLEMDRKVREFDFGIAAVPRTSPVEDEHAQFIYESRLLTLRELALMYIHRSYFARALLDHPENPLRSAYSASFLAAYTSAAKLLCILKRKYLAMHALMVRHWPTWAHALCASVIVGSIVIRSPSSAMAPLAFRDLEGAISMFQSAEEHPIIQQGLPILLRMRDRAQQMLKGAGISKIVEDGNENERTSIDLSGNGTPTAQPQEDSTGSDNLLLRTTGSEGNGTLLPVNPDVPDVFDDSEESWQSLVAQNDFISEEELRIWNICRPSSGSSV